MVVVVVAVVESWEHADEGLGVLVGGWVAGWVVGVGVCGGVGGGVRVETGRVRIMCVPKHF